MSDLPPPTASAISARHFAMALLLAVAPCAAQTTPQYSAGESWGTVQIANLKEASGLAASWRDPQLLWTHNDGSRKQLYTITAGGQHVATWVLPDPMGDVEEVAIGPGPVAGVPYLYVGDIGGQAGAGETRTSVKIVRVPEPVNAIPAGAAPQLALSGAASFTLLYPDGSYDAEAMIVDPASADIYLFTKTVPSRLYRANLNALPAQGSAVLTFLQTVSVPQPSAAAVSRDGLLIVLRDEDAAYAWSRGSGEGIGPALTRAATALPVIGTPAEPNGEALSFAWDTHSYLTLSEGASQPLYYFQSETAAAPVLRAPIPPVAIFQGATLRLQAVVSGYPEPAFTWQRNGQPLAGQTGSILTLSGLMASDAGTYSFTATNDAGHVSGETVVTVKPRPDIRLTEAQSEPSATAGSDWWELTSFEPVPVDLSGWRFNDDSGDLTNAFTFPSGLIIQPGESIVFVNDLTEAKFRTWWGAAVPSAAKVVRYTGSGLALGASGDTLRIWDAAATDPAATLLHVTIGAATKGVSFNYSPETAILGGLSQAGVNGAQYSSGLTDLGSPGAWLAAPELPQISTSLSTGMLRLTWTARQHHWYVLESSADLTAGSWSEQSAWQQALQDGAMALDVPALETAEFFRLRVR